MLLFLVCISLILAVSYGVAKLPVFRAQLGTVGKAVYALISVAIALLVGIVGYWIILDAMSLKIVGIPQVISAALVIGFPMAFRNFSSVKVREVTTKEPGEPGSAGSPFWQNGFLRIWVFGSLLSVLGFGIELGFDLTTRRDYQNRFRKNIDLILESTIRIEEEKEELKKIRKDSIDTWMKTKEVPKNFNNEVDTTWASINMHKSNIQEIENIQKNISEKINILTRRIDYGSLLIWIIPLALAVLLLGINWVVRGFRKVP